MKTKLLTIISMSLLFTGMSFAGQQKGTMKDPRDGQTYKTVKIGKQVWMAENLNFKSGDSWCYNNSEQNCNEYGRLYSWEAALNACPEGWHLPTIGEFETLISNVGGIETVGIMLKSRTGWEDYEGKSGNGIDKYGFNVLPAGARNYFGNFLNAGKYAYFWSATEINENYAYSLSLNYNNEVANLDDSSKDVAVAISVRCLLGESPISSSSSSESVEKGTFIDSRDAKTYQTVKIGYQEWMAENLNYETANSYCYNDSIENCEKYGRLYTWQAALNACPSGWHLPTKEEFETLILRVGGEAVAGKMLKSTTRWHEDGNGIDAFGFNVIPAGFRYRDGNFSYAGKFAYFWSATEVNEGYAYGLGLGCSGEDAGLSSGDKDYASSVRCLRGSN